MSNICDIRETKRGGDKQVVMWGTGTPRKLLDVSRLHGRGWQAKIGLRDGIEQTYRWFLEHQGSLRKV